MTCKPNGTKPRVIRWQQLGSHAFARIYFVDGEPIAIALHQTETTA